MARWKVRLRWAMVARRRFADVMELPSKNMVTNGITLNGDSESERRRTVAAPAAGSPLTVLMLAGGLARNSLHRAVGFPVPGMPLEADRTVLSVWMDLVRNISGSRRVGIHVICSSEADLSWFRAELRRTGSEPRGVSFLVDPRPHRGVAGVLADVIAGIEEPGEVLVLELTALPPVSLTPLFEGTAAGSGDPPMLTVGSSVDQRPAGTYLFSPGALGSVPRIGYYDLKEQLIPQMLASGRRVTAVPLGETAVRLVDRRNYLRGVRIWQSRAAAGAGAVASGSFTPPPVGVAAAGHNVICSGAVVEAGAVVLDSVIMPGARIASTAVVARSVIGPMMVIPDGAVIVEAIMADPSRDAEAIRSHAAQRARDGVVPSSEPGWSC